MTMTEAFRQFDENTAGARGVDALVAATEALRQETWGNPLVAAYVAQTMEIYEAGDYDLESVMMSLLFTGILVGVRMGKPAAEKVSEPASEVTQ